MPLPNTKDVGTLVSFLKKERPNMSVKQRIAIAMSKARNFKRSYSKDVVKMARRMK